MSEEYGIAASITLGASVGMAWAIFSCSLWAAIYIGGLIFALVELWRWGQA